VIFLKRPHTDPFFNIAAEEYVLRNFTEDVVMLWMNEPSVIVGKHQNIFKEVNLPFVLAEKIPVIRRISGGGTVFHDRGNINYTMITTSNKKERMIDFRNFLKPVMDFLNSSGLEVKYEGKNNLTIDGKKISGNSGHIFKNRVLHHGTLLFNTSLDILEKSINGSQTNIADKAISSVRAVTTNISSYINIPKESFYDSLKNYLIRYFGTGIPAELTNEDRNAIEKLAREKYETNEWTYGYTPDYRFENNWEDNEITLEVKKGLIKDVKIKGHLKHLEPLLTGKIHSPALAGEINPPFRNEMMKLLGFL
jgi:lipoate-protein ligase A